MWVLGEGKKGHLSVVPCFEFCVACVGEYGIWLVMWCTSDVSFIFVGWGVLGIRDGDGGLRSRRKNASKKKRVARERAKNRGIYHALLKKAAFP